MTRATICHARDGHEVQSAIGTGNHSNAVLQDVILHWMIEQITER